MERRNKIVLGFFCIMVLCGCMAQVTTASHLTPFSPDAAKADNSPVSTRAPALLTSTVNASGNPTYVQGSLISGSYTDTETDNGVYQVSQSAMYYANQGNTGASFCTAAQDSNYNNVGNVAWSNLSYAKGPPDSQCASVNSTYSQSSHYLICQFGNINVPATSVIVGVVIQIYRHASEYINSGRYQVYEFVRDFHVYLALNSVPVGDDRSSRNFWPTSNASATYGSPSDNWSAGVTASDINNHLLGVCLSVGISSESYEGPSGDNVFAYVDAVSATLYYAYPNYQINFNYDFHFTACNYAWVQSVTLSTEGKTNASSVGLFMWNYKTSTWDSIGLAYSSSESIQSLGVDESKYMNSSYNMELEFQKDSETSPFTVSIDLMVFTFVYCEQYMLRFTPHIPTAAPFTQVPVDYTSNGTDFEGTSVMNGSTLSVLIDACTLFNMTNVPISDYAWYEANCSTPVNVTSDTSLNVNYVEYVNQVTNYNIISNKFTPGGDLELDIILTTTYGYMPAEKVNLTIMVLSEGMILTDRTGQRWDNTTVYLQNNAATLAIRLPEDIGNGTLAIEISAYGEVEPTTFQDRLTYSSPSSGPPSSPSSGDPAVMLSMGTALVVIVGLAIVVGIRRRSSGRSSSRRSTGRQAKMLTGVQLLSSMRSIARMEFDMERGVRLKVIRGEGYSKFLQYLKEDPTRCANYFDAVKNSKGTLTIFEKGEHIIFVPFGFSTSKESRSYLKNVLVLSASRELQEREIQEIRNELNKSNSSRALSRLLSPLHDGK